LLAIHGKVRPIFAGQHNIPCRQHLHRDLGSHPAHESKIYKFPGDSTDDQAVPAEPVSVARQTVLRAQPEPGQHVLVIGVGIIGLLVLSITRIVAPESHSAAMARYLQQVEKARHLRADWVIAGGAGYQMAADVTGAQLYTGALGNKMRIGGYDVIAHRFPLADCKQAIATATNKRTGAIKVLFQMPQP